MGKIEPNSSKIVEIKCTPKDIGPIQDTFYIFISECESKYGMGIPVQITASGVLPTVQFEDTSYIFKELLCVDKYGDIGSTKKLNGHAIHIKNDNTILFNNVCINTALSKNIRFKNTSLVAAEIFVKVNDQSVFTASPEKVEILPYEDGIVTVTFSPKAMQMYNGSLDVTLLYPLGFKAPAVSYILKGEGRVPEIMVLEPESTEEGRNIRFNPTLVGKSSVKTIAFVNSGDFPCKVIIEIAKDEGDAFSWRLDEVIPFLTYYNPEDLKSTKHQTTVLLTPGDFARFGLGYTPLDVDVNSCTVRLHVIHNPFETQTINVLAESFTEDVIFDGLETTMYETECSSDHDIVSTKYIMNFGQSFIKNLQKLRFSVINQSKDYTYKFQFKTIPDISFTPSVGHLKPQSKKEIIATFLSSEPVSFSAFPLKCQIFKIEYESDQLSPNAGDISWDERQELVLYDENPVDSQATIDSKVSLRTIVSNNNSIVLMPSLYEFNTEPSHIIVKNSFKNILILFYGIVDYSTYDCPTQGIHFRDTFIYEKRKYSFLVENPGQVDLNIQWQMVNAMLTKASAQFQTNSLEENVVLRPSTVTILKRSASCTKKDIPRPLTSRDKLIIFDIPQTEEMTNSLSITAKNPNIPFSISPEFAKIPPKEMQEFVVKFCPTEMYDYKVALKGRIDNLVPTQKNIRIDVLAKSTMPYCHFDVKFSDYLTSGKRIVDKCDVTNLDMNTKVIEFDCLGVGIVHTKRFNIINPTEDDLQFTWKQLQSHEMSSLSLFQCEHSNGIITNGKQYEVGFSILPPLTGTFESLYNFKIKKYDVQMQFLLVANVKESDVYFYNTHLQMKPTVLGIMVCDYVILRNEENEEIEFNFRKSSFYSEGRRQALLVEPKKGVIGKQGEVKIKYGLLFEANERFLLQNIFNSVEFATTPKNMVRHYSN